MIGIGNVGMCPSLSDQAEAITADNKDAATTASEATPALLNIKHNAT